MKTKRRILLPIALSFSLVLILASCGGRSRQNEESPRLMPSEHGSMSEAQKNIESSENMHKQHTSLAENFAHKDIVILEEKYPVGEETQTELEQVIDTYLRLKDALFQEDLEAVDKAISSMQSKINFVNPENLDGKGLEAWENHIDLYKDKLKEMKHVKGIEKKRSYFSHISEIMYCTIKSFGLKQGNLSAVFCPMAFDNRGAYWITDNKKIQNPYFGGKMPECGEIKEDL